MADEPTTKYTDKALSERVEENPEWKKDISEKKTAKKQAAEALAAQKAAEDALAEIQGKQKKAGEAAEQAKLEGQGEYEKALAAQKETLTGEKTAETQRADGYANRIKELVGSQALTKALGAAGVPSDRLSQAALLLDRRVKVEFADGKESVTVLDEDGSPMFVEGGNPATLEDLAKDFTAKNAHFRSPNNDNGSGFHPGGTGSLTIEELDADKSGKKTEAFIKEHGIPAYIKLSSRKKKPKE